MKWAACSDTKVMRTIIILACLAVVGCKAPEEKTLTITQDSPSLFCPAANTNALPISQVTGTANRSDYPLTDTIDGQNGTFMTTQTLNMGDVKTIAYKLASTTDVLRVEIINDYNNDYFLGDLEIQISRDSTDGADGTWITAKTMNAGNHGLISGDGTTAINQACVNWVRFSMTYNGTGAFGSTPAFYLSETKLYGL